MSQGNRKARRGIMAVMAMIFLTLFATLAVGFYGTVTTSAQIAGADRRAIDARLAAESGMQFMKFQLANMDIPKATPEGQILAAAYTALSARMDGTPNMKGKTVAVSADGTKVFIPGPSNAYIQADDKGLEFRATVERFGRYGLRVTTVGRSNGTKLVSSEVRGGRGVRVDYVNKVEPGTFFGYGVATKSSISMEGNVKVVGPASNLGLASFLSTSTALNPVTLLNNATMSGDLTILPGATPVVSSTARVGNVTPLDPTFSQHVKKTSSVPEFPLIDTTDFVAFAPAKGTTGPGVLATASPPAGTYRNFRIPAGLNPTFAAGSIIEGVLVIEHPNQVKFAGSVQIKGVIVSECTPTDNNHQALVNADMANGVMDNWLWFAGTVSTAGVETLDPSVFPLALREMTGSLILIPGFQATFRGLADNLGGAIISSGMDWGGNSGGTLNGSIVNLAPNAPFRMAGNQTITITGHGTGQPAGLRFVSHFEPEKGSYKEIRP